MTRRPSTTPDARRLLDLEGVGRAMLADFEILGVRSLDQLARCEPLDLYNELCERTGRHHDICCLDVFRCAVEQARDPNLPPPLRKWWYWSQVRKKQDHARRPS